MDPFVHLHVASGYSLQYGASHPHVLVERAAAEAGSTRSVTEREADDLVRDADRFLAVVEQALGLAPHLPDTHLSATRHPALPATRHPAARAG